MICYVVIHANTTAWFGFCDSVGRKWQENGFAAVSRQNILIYKNNVDRAIQYPNPLFMFTISLYCLLLIIHTTKSFYTRDLGLNFIRFLFISTQFCRQVSMFCLSYII